MIKILILSGVLAITGIIGQGAHAAVSGWVDNRSAAIQTYTAMAETLPS